MSYYHRKNFHNKAKRKDTKGNWAYSFQKSDDLTKESQVKRSLKYTGAFDPNKVNQYRYPEKSIEEKIEDKVNRNEKLNSRENIIYQNFLERKSKAIKKDMEMIDKFKLDANVSTLEGRTKLCLLTLKYLIDNSKKDLVAKMYWKLKDYNIPDDMKKEYSYYLDKMNKIVENLDLVKLQMTTFHASQPPLDKPKEFMLEEFQRNVFDNIDNKISTIIQAPTGSGKTMAAGYLCTKGRVLYIPPTDPLAWQFASYIEPVVGANVPIITPSYKTHIKYEDLIEKVNSSKAVVGTADAILDYLPMFKEGFDWIIFDEIHMIGREEGNSMEHIARLFSNTSFLALSATIGNVDELKDWFLKIGHEKVDVVNCNKRFFNLQRFIYNNTERKLERLHPLGMVELENFEDKSILNKSLQPTPPDIWDFVIKLKKINNLGKLDPYEYFNKYERITLNQSNQYFKELLQETVNLYHNKKYKNKIIDLIKGYKKLDVKTENISLGKLLSTLKKEKKGPAIIFQTNSISLMRIVKDLSQQLEKAENKKYPSLLSDRLKQAKEIRKQEKVYEKKKIDDIPENKKRKKILTNKPEAAELELPDKIDIQEPTEDFIFNDTQYFTPENVKNWVYDLKKYFPNDGDNYHWLIIMLWRGIGVYVKGLPDKYLWLVQSLACNKKLKFVFSDDSLVFGVSMPFRTTVILRDPKVEDMLDSMLYHQMAGRAGRRGLDKEGNVVFAGYSWDRIKELSISKIPNIEGSDTMVYTLDAAQKMAKLYSNHQDYQGLKQNFIHEDITNEDAFEFYSNISENIDQEGGWEFLKSDDKHYLHMLWRLRKDMDFITCPVIINDLLKIFGQVDPNIEKEQVDVALFLSHFINVKEGTDDYILPESKHLLEGPNKELKTYVRNLGVEIPEKIDGKLYYSIVKNKLMDLGSEHLNDNLRNQLEEFRKKLTCLQNYLFYKGHVTVTRLLGKLLTRLWWIYHTSSPLMN